MLDKEIKEYLENVKKDFRQLKEEYPFSSLMIAPTVEIIPIEIKTIAANHSLIKDMHAKPEDFQGAYSRQIKIIVPFDYRKIGCQIIGGKWIDSTLIDGNDFHFHERMNDGFYQFCVGVPESFLQMQNVILENVRTAENMLIAYEQLQKGYTKTLKLKSYSHGIKGIDEYRKDRDKYGTKH